jgi:formylglycine-generating enzyme required for sulfatase activity
LIIWGLSSLPASPESTPMPFETDTVFVEPATSTAAIVPTPTLGIGSTMIGKDNATLVYVPEGEFTMGSDVDSYEQPIHKVTLDAFWIDQTEVTNANYAKCVDAGNCGSPSYGDHFNNSNYENHPVVFVNWYQANAYCSWAGRRLPTEAEWEKAARGTDGRTYPWGENIDRTFANYDQNQNVGDTSAVGSYASGQSTYGVYDMAGNVWEWTADWYGDTYYSQSPSSNPLGPDSGDLKVVRGGSWDVSRYYVRSAYRYWYDASYTYYNDYIGFRCASSLP